MAEPNTGGQLRTKIEDMQVGDYITCMANNTDSTSPQNIYNLGIDVSTRTEIPYGGFAVGSGSLGYFYFIKSDTGLLIADRVILNSVSWNVLNQKDLMQGKLALLQAKGIIRSLGGGNSYATADGKSSTTDTGNGAWPENEWDTYIVKNDYGTGAGRDDVWHWANMYTWTQDTNLNGDAYRSTRGYHSSFNIAAIGANNAVNYIGFRPVFEYQEVTP